MTRIKDKRTTRLPVPAGELPEFTPVPRKRDRHDGWEHLFASNASADLRPLGYRAIRRGGRSAFGLAKRSPISTKPRPTASQARPRARRALLGG